VPSGIQGQSSQEDLVAKLPEARYIKIVHISYNNLQLTNALFRRIEHGLNNTVNTPNFTPLQKNSSISANPKTHRGGGRASTPMPTGGYLSAKDAILKTRNAQMPRWSLCFRLSFLSPSSQFCCCCCYCRINRAARLV